MKTTKLIVLACMFYLFAIPVIAQIDTEFWFAAPEVSTSVSNFDLPIVFRISTLNAASTVVISQPANPAFLPVTVTIAANSSANVDLSSHLNEIENKPPNTLLNYGLKITASQPVNAYYEVVSSQCLCNPEIYALKGQNALGNYFLIPAQTYYSNSPNYYPSPYSSFIIVATDDNTTITITPAHNIVGHAAGIPFVINLNAGQTYSATATSMAAGQHLQGSVVNSTKPIAITYSDDLLNGPGPCDDLAGDQIVPVAVVGSKYIVTKGALNVERVSILGTQNGTSVFLDGSPTPVTTIALGQTYEFTLSNPSVYITTSHPVYVLHTSGYGCEIGIALLPSIECTGSSQIGFTRSTDELFALTLIVKNGNQDKFKLNGISNIITPSQFQPVPGTSSQWVCAQVSFTTAQVPVNLGQIVSNTGDVFHMGLINGSAGGGCRYGYFSDFSSLYLGEDKQICSGDTALLDAGFGKASYLWSTGATTQTIRATTAGQYWVQAGSGVCMLSDTIQIGVNPNPVVNLGNDTTTCEGTGYTLTAPTGFASYLWNNQPGTNVNVVSTSGLVWLKATDTIGCVARDTVLVTLLPSLPVSVTLTASANPVCQGDTVHYTAHITNAGSGAALQWYVNGLPVFGNSIINGLVAHYPFNGTLADATGNSQNAVPNGNVSWTTDRHGAVNSAYYIGGNSSGMDYLTVAHSSALAIQNPFSVSVWVNKEAHGGWIVNKGRDVVNGYGIADASCNAFVVYGQNNGAGILNTTVSLNQWHLYTCVFLSDSASFYVDGILADKQHMPSSSYASTSSNYPLAIGRHFTACCYNPDPWYYSYPYKGKVDDIRIYNRPLTTSEVWQLYSGFDSTYSYVPQNGDIVTCVVTATGTCLSNNPDTSNAIIMIVHPLPANLGQPTSNLNQGLVASYPFNGNANDESGNGHNGNVNGAVLTTDRFGNANSAYSFNGSNNWIEAPGFSMALPSVTEAAWVYFTTASVSSPSPQIVGIYPSTSEHVMQLEIERPANFVFFNSTPSGVTETAINSFTNGSWHFIVGTYNGTKEIIYFDGIKAAETDKNNTYNFNNQTLMIGKQIHPTCCYWNGFLDDIRIYNRAITASEVACLFNGTCSTLAAELTSDSICIGNNSALKIYNSQSGIKYQMLNNGINYGGFLIGNGDTLTFPINGLMQTESFTMLATNTATSCFTLLDSTFTVHVSAMNAVVSPATTICSGTPATISASGGTAYLWSNGMTTASITVSPTATTVYYVTVTNGTWCMDTDSVKVNVNPSPVPTITGLNVICLGATNITYTTQPGMTGYTWTVSGGGVITSGAGTNIITVTWSGLGVQSVGVSYTNSLGCPAIAPALLNVTVNPMPAPMITGNSSMCVASGYYDYTTEAGMANYVWSISPGGTILYGNGTNGLIVTWEVPGPQWVMVNYTNSSGCTAIMPTQMNVTVNPLPGAAGVVTGSGSVCAGATGINYSTTPIPDAVTYVWSLPFGASIASGSGTNSILVDFGPTTQSGDITVYGNNLCGNGTVSLPFHVNVSALPGLAGTPTGDEVVCQGDTGIIYYVSPILNAVNYVWDITGGGVITTGNGTNSIRAEFPTGPANCTVTVYGSNSCGAGLISPAKYVTVNLLPPVPVITQNGPELMSSAPAGNQWYLNGTLIPGADQATYTPVLSGVYTVIVTLQGCSSSASDGLYFIMTAIAKPQPFTVKVYPVPNDGKFRVYLNSGETERVSLYVMNALGQKIWELTGIELNGDKQQTVDLRPVPPGVYTLVIEGESLRVVRKVVVE